MFQTTMVYWYLLLALAHVQNIIFLSFYSFWGDTKDFSGFTRPRVQKRIKVTKVSLRSQH